ncbi:inorganic phosphate transporter [Luteimicrobium subarcticum]|uniref:inorganic phosphate transporter n=1 Tax=Luteimicrobium subarcticum TaxID=620910 RepID=UPI001FE363F8|nr:inorganic phosphate transporter [Luteimicrobium subarcticum]
MTTTLPLVLVIITALSFDFTNGFHDTGNAMATSVATGALKPRVAVAMCAVLNLVGAFLSLAVAATVAKGLVDADVVTLPVVLAGLVGAITWNLVTWLKGLPSSSSHALVGGVVGAVLAAVGTHGVLWSGLVSKVLLPALLAPLVAMLVSATGTWITHRVTRGVPEGTTRRGYRFGQIGGAGLISLAHGTNDAQKSMGIILLALIAGGKVSQDAGVPLWVVGSCGLAMAAGTYLGGWRIMRTLGKGLTDVDPRQGMAADTASAAIIMMSGHFGYSLSTTHVVSGSVLGTGLGARRTVRWSVAGRMVAGWVVTLPAAAAVAAVCYGIEHLFGAAGSVVVFGLLLVASGVIWKLSRRDAVDASNVNDEWVGATANAAADAPVVVMADAAGMTDVLTDMPADAPAVSSASQHTAGSQPSTTPAPRPFATV